MHFHRYSCRAAMLLPLALCSLFAQASEPEAPEFLPVSDSPLGATSRLLASYRLERLDDYAALLLPGFRFIFGDSALMVAHPDGFTRADEIASARNLFNGFTDASGVVRPAARSIETSLDTVVVCGEPDPPDSAIHYQVATVHGLHLRIALEDGTGFDVGPACHEFHLVRGDVAARAPDQPGDADHWYVWRWVELPSCEAIAPADAPASRQAPAERVIGWLEAPRIVNAVNPAHGAMTIWIRLPGREPATLLMFDTAGRRVLEHDLGTPGEAEVRLDLGETVRLPAGVYWLRLTQGSRVGPARAIVLR